MAATVGGIVNCNNFLGRNWATFFRNPDCDQPVLVNPFSGEKAPSE